MNYDLTLDDVVCGELMQVPTPEKGIGLISKIKDDKVWNHGFYGALGVFGSLAHGLGAVNALTHNSHHLTALAFSGVGILCGALSVGYIIEAGKAYKTKKELKDQEKGSLYDKVMEEKE